MKILCPACESPMHIIRSKQISQEVREFVGDCKNIDCGSRAAMSATLANARQPDWTGPVCVKIAASIRAAAPMIGKTKLNPSELETSS